MIGTVTGMDGAWVGVIGTGIGAALGGVVTLLSMMIKGQQDERSRQQRDAREDQRRTDDREWAAQRDNVEARRVHYSDLLQRARDLDARATSHYQLLSAGRIAPDDIFFSDSVDEARQRFDSTMSITEVTAHSADVYDRALEVAVEFDGVIAALLNRDVKVAAKRLDDASNGVQALRRAIRDDLGLGQTLY